MRSAGIDVTPIPCASESTQAALQEAIADGSGPLLLPGLCSDWPALSAWSPQNLREKYLEKDVIALIDLPGSGVLYPKDQKAFERKMKFSDFIDAMMSASASSPCYLAYQKSDEIFEHKDYDFESLIPGFGGETRAWIGSAGTRSMLHSDLKDNLFCQIWGKKSVTLMPWSDTKAAYPFAGNLVNSQVDLASPDLTRFPRLRNVTFYHSVMGPGDILLIPRGCWHDIRACTPSVSINHWFGPSQSFWEYMHLLLTLGPKYWSKTIQDLILHGFLRRRESTLFFLSPPSTGKRLFYALRWGDFSRENDPERN
jgi:lysine-specific demethylase 8